MAILAQKHIGNQHALLIQDHQRLARQGRRPGAAQFLEAMLGRGQMIAIEDLDLIAGQPTWVTGPQGLDHGLGERGGVAHQGGGHPGFDAIELVVQGGGRHPNGVFVGLIGGMDGGMDPEHDFTHQLHQRGKQELAGILLLGGAGKQVINAWRIQEPLQDSPGHHTDRALLDEGGKDGVQQHGRHLQARYGDLSNEMTI